MFTQIFFFFTSVGNFYHVTVLKPISKQRTYVRNQTKPNKQNQTNVQQEQANVNRIEMVQPRYARFVFHDYQRTSSVTDMLNKLGWPTLQERRAQAKVYMIYSIKNSLIDIPPSILHVPPHSNTRRGHSQMLFVPYAQTLTYQKSFMPDATRLWNSLPNEVIKCTSHLHF